MPKKKRKKYTKKIIPQLPFYTEPLPKDHIEAFVEEVKWKQYLKKWEKENTIDFDEIVRGSYFKK
tara:strand:- start:57987 stop:58181 length:195 start_codon:yes stop_codon:yes gene_type:complete